MLFPAWVWTRDPSKRFISAAHNEDLAIRDATEQRTLMKTEWYQNLWPIDFITDEDAKSNFKNSKKGFRKAHPISSMTGHRGNFVLVDDPHSVKSSESDVVRKGVVDNFFRSVINRLNNPSRDSIIIVMQRLHEEDLAGVILSREKLGFDHLCIPLFADGEVRKPTRIGWVDHREEGENMFPERYTEKEVAIYRESLGPFSFAGQYQQRPVPANDGFFEADWFKRYAPAQLPKHLHHYMTSDHAPGGKGDWNVIRVWGVDAFKNLWLVDSFRKKCLMDEAIGVVRDQNGKAALAQHGALPLIKKYQPLGWFPENDNTWAAIKSFVQSAMLETNTFCRIVPLPTRGSGDKMSKAQGYQAMASIGLVHLPSGPVGDDALAEYATFPAGKHDDQVDADGAIARVINDALPAFVAPAPAPSIQDDIYDIESVMSDSEACF